MSLGSAQGGGTRAAMLRRTRIAILSIASIQTALGASNCAVGSFSADATAGCERCPPGKKASGGDARDCATCPTGKTALAGSDDCFDFPAAGDAAAWKAALTANALVQCKISCDVEYAGGTRFACDSVQFQNRPCDTGGGVYTVRAEEVCVPYFGSFSSKTCAADHATTKAEKCKGFCESMVARVAAKTPAERTMVAAADYRSEMECSSCIHCEGIHYRSKTCCGSCPGYSKERDFTRDVACTAQCDSAAAAYYAQMCPVGQKIATNATDALVAQNSICAMCPAGRVQAHRGFQGRCAECPPGRRATTPAGSFQCGPFRCAEGEMRRRNTSVRPPLTLDICDLCPAGYQCVDGIATACQPTESAPGGSSRCTTCADGKYSIIAAAASCTPCDAGYACINGAKAPCSRGKFAEDGSPRCTTCADGLFALTAGASVCDACPAHSAATCTRGGLAIKAGHWFADSAVSGETELYACLFETDCAVDANSSSVRCAPGNTGPLCAVCDAEYARVGTRCIQCVARGEAIAITILLTLVGASSVAFVVFKRGQRLTKQLAGKSRKLHSVVIRVLLNWLQTASTLSLAAMKPPKEVSEVSDAAQISDGVSLSFFPVQCALHFDLFQRTIVYMLLPFAALIVPAAMTSAGFGVRWSMMVLRGKRVAARAAADDDSDGTDSDEYSADGVELIENPVLGAPHEVSGESSDDAPAGSASESADESESAPAAGDWHSSEDGSAQSADVRGEVVAVVLPMYENPMEQPDRKAPRREPFTTMLKSHSSRMLANATLGADGAISRSELRALVTGFSESDVDRWMTRFDGDGNGALAPDEFEKLVAALERERFFVSAGAAAVIGVYFIYSRVTKACLGVFNWIDIRSTHFPTKHYMSLDLSLPALDGTHIGMMVSAVLCLVLFSVATPLVVFLVLTRNRRELGSFRVRGVFGFLLDGYRPQHFYWEGVVLLRKITIVAVVYYQKDPFLQSLSAAAVFTVNIALQLAVQPFTSQLVNMLDVLSMALLFATQIAAQVRWYLDDSKIRQSLPYKELMLILLVIAHAVLLLIFAWIIARAWLRDDRVGQQVSKRLCGCSRACAERCNGRQLEQDAATLRLRALFAERRAEIAAESAAMAQRIAENDSVLTMLEGASQQLNELLADATAVTSRTRAKATTIIVGGDNEGGGARVYVDHRSLVLQKLDQGYARAESGSDGDSDSDSSGSSSGSDNGDASDGGGGDDDDDDDDSSAEWYYEDEASGVVHGPYAFSRVLGWIDKGIFHAHIKVRRQRDGPNIALRSAVHDSASCSPIVQGGWHYVNGTGVIVGPHTLTEFNGWRASGHFHDEMHVQHGVYGSRVTLAAALLWLCAVDAAPLPAGWTAHRDSSSIVYFHCTTTGESTYEQPSGAAGSGGGGSKR